MDYTPETLRKVMRGRWNNKTAREIAEECDAHADAWKKDISLRHMAEVKVLSREAIIKQLSETQLAQDVAKAEARVEELETKLREVAAMFEELDKKDAGLQVHLATIDEIIDAIIANAERPK